MKKLPLKPSTSIPEQITRLRERGMSVDDKLARQWLTNVGYYRLSAYSYPARVQHAEGRRGDEFRPGTTFGDVTALYEADRKLRTLVHDGIERIEVSMRARIVAQICADDPLGHEDNGAFRASFKHADWLDLVAKRVDRAAKHTESIRHHQQKYGGDYPFWVLAEVLDFSDISKLYEGLTADHQQQIAEGLGIIIDLGSLNRRQRRNALANPPLMRWLEQLTIVRNIAAHHARLWNKSFAPAPTNALRTIATLATLPQGQSERTYGALAMMSHLLRIISPGTSWPDKVASLIKNDFLTNPLVEGHSLGLPDDWNTRL